jgi:hypothetical protein
MLLQHVLMQLLHAWLPAGQCGMHIWHCTCTASTSSNRHIHHVVYQEIDIGLELTKF